MYNFLSGLFGGLIDAVGQAVSGLANILYAIIKPILDLIMGLIYLIQKLLYILVLIIKVVLGLFQVFVELVREIVQALSGLSYTGTGQYYNLPSEYHEGFNAVSQFFSMTGFNTVAMILCFFVWLLAVYCIIRKIAK